MTMAAAKTDAFDSLFALYAHLWLGLWECASVVGGASLEGIGLFWALQRPREESLAALGQTLDAYLRAPAFLDLSQRTLKMLSRPPSFGVLTPFPGPLARKRASR